LNRNEFLIQPGVIAMFPQLGVMEMIVVMGVAVLLFGSRLPEVGRSLGKGIIEFKKGLRGIEDELDFSGSSTPSRRADERPRASASDYADTAVPKFEAPTSAPVPHMEYPPPQD
jgi:sec-independent protein translocase protein TatA